MIFLFNRVIFRFYVSFQGCICFIKKMIIQLSRKEDRILQPLKCHRSFLRDLAMDTTSMTFVEKSQGFRWIKNGSFLLYIFSRCTPLPQRCMGRKGTWSYVQIHTGDVHVPSIFGNRHYSMYQSPEKRRHHAWDCQMVEIWTKLKLFLRGGYIVVVYVYSLGGGLKCCIFSALIMRKWSNLTNIFEMGWNHQPVLSIGVTFAI